MIRMLGWLAPIHEAFVAAMTPKDVIYFDVYGNPIEVPAHYVPYAQQADEDGAGESQGTLGATTMFGPYTSAQLRSVALIAQAEPDIDMALLSIVAHTVWTQDTEEGEE
jgi:hypothetical protein